jgi:glyoxylase-like metal-dependent hydrolase (beta-lactamase superfamily II)
MWPSFRGHISRGIHVGIRIGDYELTVLVDTHGVLGSLAELFPGVPGEAWGPYRNLYPELFDGEDWRLPFGCFLLGSERHTLLVDAGVGPPQGSFLPSAEGLLPTALAEVGVDPDEIDICVLTHLHIDHIGWVCSEGRPLCPRASYIASRRDFNWVEGREPLERDRVLQPLLQLVRSGSLALVEGTTEVAPGVQVVPTPGHTPGHSSIRIASRGSEAIILGDVAVHPALLDHPEWVYLFDVEPEPTVATRRVVLGDIEGKDVIVACGHYPGGVGRLEREGRRTIWRAVE